MEAIWRYFKVQLPGYLRSLPLPKSIAGFSELTREEWLELLPFFLFLIILLYLVLSPFLNVLTRAPKKTRPTINRKVKKDEAKVVDSFDIEDLAKDAKDGKVAYCRCWKSKKFPYCDGTHNTHNKETGDNIGPLVVKCNKEEKKKSK